MIKLSVVIPIYNEEALLQDVFKRFDNLANLLNEKFGIKNNQLEFLYVNDGSKDSSLAQLIDHSNTSEFTKCINLARNFGHQLAITSGINKASGDAVVVIDGDLQDPPEFIVDLYQRHLEGIDVVYAVRKKRLGETWFKLYTARWFYKLISSLSQIPIIQNVGDFRLMSRRVVDVFNQMPEEHRFIRGMIPWVGFKQEGLKYERDKRYRGVTKFSLKKMIDFSIDGITSFSSIPLRLVGLVGIIISFMGIIYSLYAIYQRFWLNTTVPGWTSLVVLFLIIGGVQLICLGVIGEYIARIHDQVKQRPLYVIENIYG